MITVITVMTTMITVMIWKEKEELPKLITLVGAMKTLGIEIRDTISTEDDLLPAADEVVVPSVKWALVPCLYCGGKFGGIGALKRHLHYCTDNPKSSKRQKVSPLLW